MKDINPNAMWPFLLGCVLLIGVLGALGLLVNYLEPSQNTRLTFAVLPMAAGCIAWLRHDIKTNDSVAPLLAFLGMPPAFAGAAWILLDDFGLVEGRNPFLFCLALGLVIPGVVIAYYARKFDYEISAGMKVWWGICVLGWFALLGPSILMR
jgi:hypothetical protein